MKTPEIPANENQRMASLKNLHILDTPIEEAFERITRLAKAVFNVPISAFSLIDSERQWFKSIQGLSVCETSRDVSFCGHAINQDGIFIVNNALEDPRFADNPLVTGEPNIRFYAGCPVYSPDKQRIGTLCIIDIEPRNFKIDDLTSLKDMAALLEAEIINSRNCYEKFVLAEELSQAKKSACVDRLTRLTNRAGIEDTLKKKIAESLESKKDFGIAMIDIDNFKEINDLHGHAAGDEVLRQISKLLMMGYRETDIIGRWGGEEFLVILDIKRNTDLFELANRTRKIIAEHPLQFEDKPLNITITTGVCRFESANPVDLATLTSRADLALYKGKRQGKNIVVNDEDLYTIKPLFSKE
jgi:diguanylate cyclase (GGDEF)-like protein